MFARFECGCKGIILTPERVILLEACDRDPHDNELGFRITNRYEVQLYPTATVTPMSDEEIDSMCRRIHHLIQAGYDMEYVRSVMKARE